MVVTFIPILSPRPNILLLSINQGKNCTINFHWKSIRPSLRIGFTVKRWMVSYTVKRWISSPIPTSIRSYTHPSSMSVTYTLTVSFRTITLFFYPSSCFMGICESTLGFLWSSHPSPSSLWRPSSLILSFYYHRVFCFLPSKTFLPVYGLFYSLLGPSKVA